MDLVPRLSSQGTISEAAAAVATRPDEIAMARQLAERVRQCIASKLPGPKSRHMLELLCDRMLTTDEIVAETGMEREQVSRWRHTIREKAKECLKEMG